MSVCPCTADPQSDLCNSVAWPATLLRANQQCKLLTTIPALREVDRIRDVCRRSGQRGQSVGVLVATLLSPCPLVTCCLCWDKLKPVAAASTWRQTPAVQPCSHGTCSPRLQATLWPC